MSEEKFSINEINNWVKDMSENIVIPYEELPQYDLFLSQVTDYLNDHFKNEHYTNNIIQNYIKSEVISKPEAGKKRGYTKLHLTQLALLSYMRPILTTDEVKKVFRLAFNDINERNDDIINWEQAYATFCEIQKDCFNSFIESNFFDEEKAELTLKQFNLEEKDKERMKIFLIVMTLIAQSSLIKDLAQKIIDNDMDEKV